MIREAPFSKLCPFRAHDLASEYAQRISHLKAYPAYRVNLIPTLYVYARTFTYLKLFNAFSVVLRAREIFSQRERKPVFSRDHRNFPRGVLFPLPMRALISRSVLSHKSIFNFQRSERPSIRSAKISLRAQVYRVYTYTPIKRAQASRYYIYSSARAAAPTLGRGETEKKRKP